MGGQNSEEAAELVATIRGEHVVMKNWFMGPTKEAGELRAKYGPYPGLWKEVLNWPGWLLTNHLPNRKNFHGYRL